MKTEPVQLRSYKSIGGDVIVQRHVVDDVMSAAVHPVDAPWFQLSRTEGTALEEPCLEPGSPLPRPTWRRSLLRATKVYIGPILLFLAYSFGGAALFHHLEARNEEEAIEHFQNLRTEALVKLWRLALGGNMSEAEWTAYARSQWHKLDELARDTLQPGIPQALYSEGETMWTFWGALLFCGTVYTTIGYGFIVPKTVGGRAACMVYALLGIPLCMMVLAKIGKLLSISLGRLWMLIKHCAQYVYSERKLNCLSFHRDKHKGDSPSAAEVETGNSPEARSNDVSNHVMGSPRSPVSDSRSFDQVDSRSRSRDQTQTQTSPLGSVSSLRHSTADSDAKDVTSDDVTSDVTNVGGVEDENFTISPIFAVLVLVLYILSGAFMYGQWEKWDYFESAYFIFTSLTTIGFGDLTPAHPKFFISSSIYIFVGLTLVSLVINTIIDTLKKGMKKAKAAPAVILKRHQRFNLRKERDSYDEIAVHHPLEHGDSVQLASIRIPLES